MVLSDVVAGADCAEFGFGVQVEAGGVFGKIPDWMIQIPAVSVEPLIGDQRGDVGEPVGVAIEVETGATMVHKARRSRRCAARRRRRPVTGAGGQQVA